MTLGVLPEQGGSLRNLAASGQADRFVVEYLARYARAFERVEYFSYVDERKALPEGCGLVSNRFRLHRWIYAWLMPVLHWRAFRRCDVLRVMQLTGEIPAILANRLHGIPFVATYGYRYDRHARADGAGRIRAALFRFRTRLALRFAARVIVTNPDIRDEVERLVGAGRVAYIPNAVDTRRFAPGPPDARECDVILYVGRLSPQKNLTLLIDAAALLERPVVLRFVGSGPEAQALAAHASRRGVTLELRGTIPHADLPSELTRAVVFALPSVIEGHPKALIEAMSCGCVVVGARAPGISEVIDDGRTGLLASPDPAGFARTLARALNDTALQAALADAARQEVLARFDINSTLAAEIDLLRAVGRGRRR